MFGGWENLPVRVESGACQSACLPASTRPPQSLLPATSGCRVHGLAFGDSGLRLRGCEQGCGIRVWGLHHMLQRQDLMTSSPTLHSERKNNKQPSCRTARRKCLRVSDFAGQNMGQPCTPCNRSALMCSPEISPPAEATSAPSIDASTDPFRETASDAFVETHAVAFPNTPAPDACSETSTATSLAASPFSPVSDRARLRMACGSGPETATARW
eukprot:821075-Rhodomonas_salina.3